MKKGFRKLFSGVTGVLIVGALFGIILQVHAAISTISISTPISGALRSGTQAITWTNDSTWLVDIQYCKEPSCTSASYTTITWNVTSSGGGSYSWNTATAAGDSTQYRIRIRAAGNDSIATISNYFTIDNTAPTGGGFSINGGATYTTGTAVTLNTTCATDALIWWVQVAYGNTASPTNWTTCSSSISWTLTAGDATKTVYMRFRDSLWNVTSDITHTIIYDTTAPAALSLTSPTVLSGWVSYNITWVTPTDTNLWTTPIKIDYSALGDFSDTQNIIDGHAAAGPQVWTVPSVNLSTAKLRITATDLAWNSTVITWSAFTIDSTAPSVYSVSALPSIASGLVAVTVTFTESLAGINTAVAPTIQFNNGTDHVVTASGAAWHTNWYITTTPTIWEWTINVSALTNTTNGFFKVSWAKDLAANIMSANNNVGSLTVDTAGPTFTINNGNAAWPVKTDIFNITLNDATSVASASYGFSLDATCNGSDTYGNSFSSSQDFSITWNYHSPNTWLCLKAVDGLGNISYTWGFILNTDNTAPTIQTNTLTSPTGSSIRAGWSVHNITWTNGDITDANSLWSNPITLKYSTDGESRTTIATGLANNGSYAWTLPSIDSNTVVVHMFATDTAGNTTAEVATPSFIIDSTIPTVDIWDDVTINSSFTKDATVDASLAGVASYAWAKVSWPGTITFWSSTGSETTISASQDGTYVIALTVVDNAGQSNSDEFTLVYDTQSPTVTFNIPTDASNTMSIAGLAINTGLSSIDSVRYIFDSKEDGYNLTLANAGTTTKSFNGTIDVSDLLDGPHVLYVQAHNLAGTRWPTSYQSFNVNEAAPDITSLYMSNVTSSSATINWETNGSYQPVGINSGSEVDEYRIKANNDEYSSWYTLESAQQDIGELNANTTYIVEIKASVGTNSSTDTVSFKTAAASDGIVVDSISRILDGSTPTPGGDYASGYHFRFNLTVNNIWNDTLNFKLADWSNGVNTMAVANNTKIFVSQDGVDSADYDYEPTYAGTQSATLTWSNVYSSDLEIYHIDADNNKWGKQIVLDMFYKIPSWAQGIFSTSYGIQVSSNEW